VEVYFERELRRIVWNKKDLKNWGLWFEGIVEKV
jgi:hypothetical protein